MNFQEAMDLLKQTAKIPYPKITNVKEDLVYANMLLEDYAGYTSEVSAICQYVYEHIAIVQNENVKKIMEQVAIVEMRHLNLLGELIRTLGMDPIYVNRLGQMWKADYLCYQTKDIEELMKFNIKGEQVAIQNYQKDASYTNNLSVKDLFNRIIIDEKGHIRIFSGIASLYPNY